MQRALQAQGCRLFCRCSSGWFAFKHGSPSGFKGRCTRGISGLASGTAKELGVSRLAMLATIGSAASKLASYALPSASGGSAPSYTPPVQPGLNLQGPQSAPAWAGPRLLRSANLCQLHQLWAILLPALSLVLPTLKARNRMCGT